MNVYKIVFSPTGGTEKVAEIISNEFSNDVKTIDLSDADFSGYSLESDSIAVIAVPSFGGRAPEIAVERLKNIKANGSEAVVVAVYGNRAQEDTMIEIADVSKECGFDVIAGISAIAEHSIAHQYATGRPDSDDAKQLKEFAVEIMEKLKNNKSSAPEIPGNRPYKKAGVGLVPSASSKCVSCGLCVKKCPAGAIDKINPKNTDKKLCINCMRCVAICPHKARTVSDVMVKIVGVALKKECSKKKENELFI